MNVAQNYFAPYRYRPPMPLEDTSRHYYYCAPGGLPPLAPRKKKKKMKTKTRPAAAINNNNSTLSTTTTTTNDDIVIYRQQVHWPDDLDQHKQVVEFNKADAILACNIGSHFEGEWYYDSIEDVFYDSMENELRTPCWWEWNVLQYQLMNSFPKAFYILGLVYLFLIDFMAGEDREWEDDNEDGANDNIEVEDRVPRDDDYYFYDCSNDDDDEEEEEYNVGEELVREPIVEEVAPPEQQQPEEQTQLVEALSQQEQQNEELSDLELDANTDDISFGVEDDDDEEEEEDGSDYYFSLQSKSVSESAINYFMSMRVMGEAEEITTVIQEQELFAMEFDAQEEDTMYVEAAYDVEDVVVQEHTNIMETVMVLEDATEDAEASIPIDEASVSNKCPSGSTATAVLGSIWVPDPKHGLVRRSARLRVRG